MRQLIKNKSVATILNGSKIKNRDEDRPEISYTTSGSLNKDNKYMTVNLKQRNAMKDKSRGVTITTYDKLAEISNSSGKDYILDFYGNPTKLFRTEVHLNNAEIKDYLEGRGLSLNYYMLDEVLLEECSSITLIALSASSRTRRKFYGNISWDVLDRVITTTSINIEVIFISY